MLHWLVRNEFLNFAEPDFRHRPTAEKSVQSSDTVQARRSARCSLPTSNEPAGRGNPNRFAKVSGNRAHGAAAQNTSRSLKGGCEERKIPAAGGVFFLTSSFIYRTNQELLSPLR